MDARREIEGLVYRYAECVDTGNLEGVAELFADGHLVGSDGSELAQGYDETLKHYRDTVRLYPNHETPLTQHVMSNLVVDIIDDTASGSCQYTVFQQTDTLPLQPIIAGRYRDKFERANGRWQFRERQFLAQLFGDLSQHLTEDALRRFT